MLFRKDIEPCCAYCRRGSAINEYDAVCIKKGVVPLSYSCSAFRYDPLKREPPKPLRLPKNSGLMESDFAI